jgi:hypothetical protein
VIFSEAVFLFAYRGLTVMEWLLAASLSEKNFIKYYFQYLTALVPRVQQISTTLKNLGSPLR